MNCEYPSKIKVSLGTAIVLGLLDGKLDANPSTAYFMTFKIGKCTANCGFCPQARTSKSNAELLSRVSWPTFSFNLVLKRLRISVNSGKIHRVCIQALNYPSAFLDICGIVKAIKNEVLVPISVSCQPFNQKDLISLRCAGVDRVGIALDATTADLFDKFKGRYVGSQYTWANQFKKLNEALEVFGKGNISTHLIVGLGESEQDVVISIQECVDLNVLPALFAFTPIPGTLLSSNSAPNVLSYRRLQLARYLIANKISVISKMRFDKSGKILDYGVKKLLLKKIIETGKPFLTSGCPDCNRPFYNEKPSGPIYNYPFILKHADIMKVKAQFGI